MLNIFLARILIVFLVIYSVHYVIVWFRQRYVARKQAHSGKREYTTYDASEWNKIKKSLSDVERDEE